MWIVESKCFYYFYFDCICVVVVKVRFLFLNEKDKELKNIVEILYDVDFSR